MKGILHKTKVGTQWCIFQAHEKMCAAILKRHDFSTELRQGETETQSDNKIVQRNRSGPVEGKGKKGLFFMN